MLHYLSIIRIPVCVSLSPVLFLYLCTFHSLSVSCPLSSVAIFYLDSLFGILYPTGITGELGCMYMAAIYLYETKVSIFQYGTFQKRHTMFQLLFCLFLGLSGYTHQFLFMSFNFFLYLLICPCVHLFNCLLISLLVHLPTYLFEGQYFRCFVCLFVCVSMCRMYKCQQFSRGMALM